MAKEIVYSKNSVEFVTVAVQYCVLLESAQNIAVKDLVDKLTKMLPLLYLKASMGPSSEMMDDDMPEMSVTEDDYNYIMSGLYQVFGKDDAYLEVFLQDMKYSETPIAESISENLTDIYQDLKNCLVIYERGIDENMNDALYVCMENFKTYWGQKLVNALRALHSLKYSEVDDSLEEEPLQTEEDDIW